MCSAPSNPRRWAHRRPKWTGSRAPVDQAVLVPLISPLAAGTRAVTVRDTWVVSLPLPFLAGGVRDRGWWSSRSCCPASKLVKDVPYTGPRQVDIVGAVLSVLGMGGIVLGILVWQEGREAVGALLAIGA